MVIMDAVDIMDTPTPVSAEAAAAVEAANPLNEAAVRASEQPPQEGAGQVVSAESHPNPEAEPAIEEIVENWVTLKLEWNGKKFDVKLADSDRVYDLKALLYSLTAVPPERQKILGLVKGKLPPEEATIQSLSLISGAKFRLLGTPQGGELPPPALADQLDVFNDLDVEITAAAARAFHNDARNKRKLADAIAKLNINIMNPPREGKRLLVLDLDYTIVDTKPLSSGALPPMECARPSLHTFLEQIYPHYDICIWSQTSWMWLEAKLVELGMVGSDVNYKISFVLDRTCMFSVFSDRQGEPFRHHVKPLEIIWKKFPALWGPHNTIHVDDLGRNFALNPNEGVKVHAFKDCHTTHARNDRELLSLASYMLTIAQVDDFKTLQGHKHWRRFQLPGRPT